MIKITLHRRLLSDVDGEAHPKLLYIRDSMDKASQVLHRKSEMLGISREDILGSSKHQHHWTLLSQQWNK